MIELSRNMLGGLRFYGSLAAGLGAIFFSPGLSAANAPSEPINAESAAPRIEALRREIAHHDELYYKKAAPEISDAAYDRLKQTLAALEQKFPAAAAGESPSESLGDDRTGAFALYRHRERMLSLEKSYRESDVRAFHARLAQRVRGAELVFVIEPKFDGLAVSVTYEKGRLVRAVTRGNGVEGDDVTANALTIGALPRQLRAVAPDGTALALPDVIELRGEIYLPLAEFARINREREAAGEAPFAHPRNLAVGTLKLLDPRDGRSGNSRWFFMAGARGCRRRRSPFRSARFTRACALGVCPGWSATRWRARRMKRGRRFRILIGCVRGSRFRSMARW